MSGSSEKNSQQNARLQGRYDARFWMVTLSALVAIGLTISLGVWQLNRAAQKEQISATRANAQPIVLNGQWATNQTVYVDNRQMTVNGQSKQGFFVVTPLVTSSAEYVLVERGWITRDFVDRKKLAPVDTPSGTVSVEARKIADPVPAAAFANKSNDEYPIVQFVDLGDFAKALQGSAYKGMVQQIGAASEGLKRNWYEPVSGSSKNYGYAFQWFALSTLVAGLYMWYQWIKPKRKNKT